MDCSHSAECGLPSYGPPARGVAGEEGVSEGMRKCLSEGCLKLEYWEGEGVEAVLLRLRCILIHVSYDLRRKF